MANPTIGTTERERIRKWKETHPDWSSRRIAEKFGIHHKTINRILKGKGAPVSSSPNEVSEVKGDQWVVTLPKTRIHTLDQLIEYFQVDTAVWEVERFICNKWEVGRKEKTVDWSVENGVANGNIHDTGKIFVEPLFQVKAFLRKKKDIVAVKKEIEELKKQAKENSSFPKHSVKSSNSGLMLELNMPDIHFGKLAWAVETGHDNYDVKIAESVYWTALETLLDRVSGHKFEQILLVLGNDLFNSDDIEGRTTSGTYVSSDCRYHKTFGVVRRVKVQTIERLRKIAPVVVKIVPGNHDKLSSWHLGDSLECYFHNYKDVTIDNSPKVRKYHRFGNNMLMLVHGHKGKKEDYPLLMATEQPQMFGETKYREVHTGHIHKEKVDEKYGIKVRILSALTAVDDWLTENAFVNNLRCAEAFVWHKEEGLIGTAIYTVQNTEAA